MFLLSNLRVWVSFAHAHPKSCAKNSCMIFQTLRCKKDGNITELIWSKGNIWILDWFWCIRVSFSSLLLLCNYYTADHLPWQFANPPGCSQGDEHLPSAPFSQTYTFVQIANGSGLEGGRISILWRQCRHTCYSCPPRGHTQNSWQLQLEQDQEPSTLNKKCWLYQATYKIYVFSRKIKCCCRFAILMEKKEIVINTHLWVCWCKTLV